MLRYQLRNTILTPAALISVLGLYLFMILSVAPHPTTDIMYNYQYATQIGYGSYFMPVAVVIPICFFLHHTGSQKDRQFPLIRSRLSAYTGSAVATASLSGMVVAFCAFLLFTLTCLVYSPDGTPYIGLGLVRGFQGLAFYARFSDKPIVIYSIMGAVYTLNGAMWPLISLLCFSFTANQYVVASIPFILKTLIAYVSSMLEWFYLDPGQLMLFGGVSGALPGGGIPYMLCYIGIVVAFCAGIWLIRANRTVRYA